MPPLDNPVITADALHCQLKVARDIVEKGGDSLLQIRGDQTDLEEWARAKDATPVTPFLP